MDYNGNTAQSIQKGIISALSETVDINHNPTAARVIQNTATGVVTQPLLIPWRLRGSMGDLRPGVEVVYAVFADGTGIILDRLDDEYGSFIQVGEIASLEDPTDANGNKTKAKIKQSSSGNPLTNSFIIPWHLRGVTGGLEVGTGIIFVAFPNGTGLILGRSDGEWGQYLHGTVGIETNLNVPLINGSAIGE